MNAGYLRSKLSNRSNPTQTRQAHAVESLGKHFVKSFGPVPIKA